MVFEGPSSFCMWNIASLVFAVQGRRELGNLPVRASEFILAGFESVV